MNARCCQTVLWSTLVLTAAATAVVAQDSCADFVNCGQCVTTFGCGWCDGQCKTGTASGPVEGECSSWTWEPAGCGSAGGGGADSDGDGTPNSVDNCPTVANGDQADADGDGIGDVCDSTPHGHLPDSDGDGTPDDLDRNPTNPDANGNGILDGHEIDSDGDGIVDADDPTPGNPDLDGDGVLTSVDNCLLHHNPGQEDRDGDGRGDACDCAPDDAAFGDYNWFCGGCVANASLATLAGMGAWRFGRPRRLVRPHHAGRRRPCRRFG